MTERFCKCCRGWHSLDRPWPDNCRPERNWNRADFAMPRLIRDGLDDVWNPADNKIYDSKSNFEKAVKAKGLVIAGNDSSITQAHEKPATVKTPGGLKEDLKQAWEANS
ncbi:MAG TPA: hypothetical protein VK196_22345 [Magnetospirillum sp.]|nr:hypothetical protein [Magnetospirillum sp.]